MSTVDPYAFMSPSAAAAGVALRTPMERRHVAAGATVEECDGWRVGVYPEDGEHDPWIADVSHLGKLDLRGTAAELDDLTGGLGTGAARRDGEVWTLRLTPTHGYVLCAFPRLPSLRDSIAEAARLNSTQPPNAVKSDDLTLAAIDVTCGLAGLAVGGSRWRHVMNRSSGLDVRDSRFPANRCMAGSVMRVPTLILNEGDGISMFVGWEYGEYFWDAILDAGAMLGIAARTPAAARSPEAVA
ncbi:MAG TPA: sarcosine oxidase subunit gamma family protein [Gaiellales bacterium]